MERAHFFCQPPPLYSVCHAVPDKTKKADEHAHPFLFKWCARLYCGCETVLVARRSTV